MYQNNNEKNVVRRVSFTPEENEVICQRAYAAEMSPAAYIRQQALHGVVQSIDWDALRVHADLLCNVAMDLHLHLDCLTNLERKMLSDVLSIIEGDLNAMLSIEQDVFKFLSPGLEM